MWNTYSESFRLLHTINNSVLWLLFISVTLFVILRFFLKGEIDIVFSLYPHLCVLHPSYFDIYIPLLSFCTGNTHFLAFSNGPSHFSSGGNDRFEQETGQK